MMNDRLSSIMTINVITLNPNDSLLKAKELIFSRHIHHLPVVEGDNNKLVGIFTSYDILKLGASDEQLKSMKVGDVMTTKIATLGPTELIGAAAQLFLKHLFHGLPIVNDDRELLGIVTTHDILKYEFYKEYPDDAFVKDTNW